MIRQRLHEAFKSTVEYITPPLAVSAFREKGVLTPEEFVVAGDNLVSKCPTWSWEGGDSAKRKPYLPPEKQFLITRNVPCLRRAGSVEEDYAAAGGEQLVDDDADGGWLATHGAPADRSAPEENIPSMDGAEEGEVHRHAAQARGAPPGQGSEDDDDDVPDMAEFEEQENMMDLDPATLPYMVAREPDDDNILRTRTYDMSITYDKYYQTPRVWLFGYDEARQPLHPEKVLEDVSQDHARKTVTIEDHPHLPGRFASVHPCKHGAVMKKIVDVISSNGVEPRIHQYLFIFLKFVASIIPTIQYDNTLDFDLGPATS